MNRQSDWNTSSIADVIADKCKNGWVCTIYNKVFSIKKNIKRNNDAAFNEVQAEGIAILKLMPTSAPSKVWGLDNSHAIELAKKEGFIKLNKSSCNGQVLRKLKELVLE